MFSVNNKNTFCWLWTNVSWVFSKTPVNVCSCYRSKSKKRVAPTCVTCLLTILLHPWYILSFCAIVQLSPDGTIFFVAVLSKIKPRAYLDALKHLWWRLFQKKKAYRKFYQRCLTWSRSSCPEVFCRKGVLRNLAKFTCVRVCFPATL